MAGVLTAAMLGAAATSLAAGFAPQPGAAPPPGPETGFAAGEPGKTTVGVQVSRADPAALSFEVPLYVTVAVVSGDRGAEVICPTTYSIRNLSTDVDGATASAAVTGIAVRGAPGGTWSLERTPLAEKEISMEIGGVQLPQVSAGAPSPVQADLRARDNVFYDPAAGKFREISAAPGGTGLLLNAGVAPGITVNASAGASAQFRCIYTVSLLDRSGAPIGIFYDGPSRDLAVTP